MHILENVREPSRPIDIPNKKKNYAYSTLCVGLKTN